MGNEMAIPMELCSHFEPDEIRRLGKRFRKLDLDGSGSLSVDEFMSIPDLQQNPLVQRVIDIFDADGNGEVDFREFIQGISQFSVNGDKEAKLKFAFKIYDMDRDGFISNGELFQVLKMMVGNNLKDAQLQQIVDKTIIYADKDNDGKISFEEFKSVIDESLRANIESKMTVHGAYESDDSSGEETDDGVDSDDYEDAENNEVNVIPRTSNELVQSLVQFVVTQESLKFNCNTKCKTKRCPCIIENKKKWNGLCHLDNKLCENK
ncbi:unnamed protein product [Brachionus calyciflorus]|uniref:EF-hand domain-containing protein n=1 Tax=Brachionus calyciflorus TaxID=104777 RepID=A0A814EAE8_9BILA|nr:unnamed protein product [Brachionus calyciflorus]